MTYAEMQQRVSEILWCLTQDERLDPKVENDHVMAVCLARALVEYLERLDKCCS